MPPYCYFWWWMSTPSSHSRCLKNKNQESQWTNVMTHLFTSLSFLHRNLKVITFLNLVFPQNIKPLRFKSIDRLSWRSRIKDFLRNHGQIFGPLDPFVSVPRSYDTVASPCHLFSRDHDHIVETSRADHYRAPCGNRRIAPLVPTSVAWDDRCVPLSYKKGNPSAVLPLTSLACFRVCRCFRPATY
jgi:hypothetical protein